METALNDNIGSEYGAPMDVLAALFDARGWAAKSRGPGSSTSCARCSAPRTACCS